MIDDIINQLLFTCRQDHVQKLLQTLSEEDRKKAALMALESFCKRRKTDARDLKIIQEVAKVFSMNNDLDKNLFNVFRLAEKISIWIAITRGYNYNNLQEKTRVFFLKNIKKSPTLWLYERLQRFMTCISTKDDKLKQQHHQQIYDEQIYNIEYTIQFLEQNQKYIPANFDYRDVLVKYVCMNRMQSPKQKSLLSSIISKLFKLSNEGLFHSSFRYCFQFYRFPYDQKNSPYKPIFPIFQIVKRLPVQSIALLIQNSFLGLIWTEQNYTSSIKNCINSGIISNTLILIQKLKLDALKNNMVQALINILESDVMKAFVYLKFEPHFKNSFELLQIFILGAPPRAKAYQKFISKIKNVIFSIPQQFKSEFYTFLQALKVKYQQFCDTKQLDGVIAPLLTKQFYKPHDKQELKAYIKKYDWANQSKIQQSKQSQYKGLYNIGNSCYMNSFVQALYMTKEFRFQILSIDILEKQKQLEQKLKIKASQSKNNAQVIKDRLMPLFELQKLFSLLYKSSRPCINPTFFKAVLPSAFRNSFQQDAAQFGRIYLGILDEIIPLIFQGIGQICVECLECKQQRRHKDKFLDIILSCEDSSDTVPNLLKQVNHCEELQGIQCSTCNKKVQKSIRQHNIKILPNYAIITFNRFTYDVSLKKKVKLDFKVPLSEIIQLPFLSENREALNSEYELYAIIVHRGTSSESGHYYTFTKQMFEQNSKWLCFNDSSVTELANLTKVSQFLDGSVQDTPYMLFYQSRDHVKRIKLDKLFMTPFLLSQKLREIVQKQDLEYLKSSQKATKFSLPKLNFNFKDLFKKDEDDEQNGGGGFGNNRLIM